LEIYSRSVLGTIRRSTTNIENTKKGRLETIEPVLFYAHLMQNT
jgi:hypothetical protein